MKPGRLAPIAAFALLLLYTLNVSAFGAAFTVTTVEAAPGETVTVPVAVSNNPGFCYLKLRFSFDAEKLEFLRAENGTVSADSFLADEGALLWDSGADAAADGTLVNLVFLVKETADGAAAVRLSVTECYNYDEQAVAFAVNDGSVLVKPAPARLKGDVDGNGLLEAADARLALRASVQLEDYAAGSAQFLAADADGDGVLRASDARLILRAAVGLENLQ